MNSLKPFAQLIRLPNLFTAASNVVAAHFIATQGSPQWSLLLLTLISSLCFYHGGMIFNDCFDIDEDKVERPNRPIPSGAISLMQGWTMVIGLMTVGLVVCFALGALPFSIALLLVVAIVVYNLSNRSGYFGCLAMGACRLLNWCLALSVVSGFTIYWLYALIVGIYVTALTLISRDETQAQRPQLVNYCAVVMLCGASLFILTLWQQNALDLWGLAILIAALVVVITRLIKLKNNYSSDNIQAMVMFFVLGLIPLDAILVLIAGYPLFAMAIFTLLLPSRFLAKRLYVT